MTIVLSDGSDFVTGEVHEDGRSRRHEAREEMARRIPRQLQPFLTWLTARPAPGEAYRTRTPAYHVSTAFLSLVAGTAAGAAILAAPGIPLWLLPLAWLVAASGMGKLQAVVYHHCAHGTVFHSRRMNRVVGTFIGMVLLVKQFDLYQKEHMLHHSPKKLLTHEDEFADFIFRLAGLEAGLPKAELWRRVALSFVSPFFHARFLLARISSCLLTQSTVQNLIGIALWAPVLTAVSLADLWLQFTLFWLVPLVILFQIATALRVLCEHRFPDSHVTDMRDKHFVSLATAGVFAGSPVPSARADTAEGLLAWARWWAEMLTVHLFTRIFVLVGDAPCHDYHHRRPASRQWPSYIYAREADLSDGCPGYPLNYIETWGLFRAIDENLASLSRTRKRRS